MASKKTQINNPLFGTSEVDPLDSNSLSSPDIPYTGPMTRGRIKAFAEVYAQTTPIPNPRLFSTLLKLRSHKQTHLLRGQAKM